MYNPSPREQARQRAEMILKVRGGQITAQEAARGLGISRKTYYKWEQRGLAAMLDGLCERSSGRPASRPDGEKESLQTTVGQLQMELKEQEQRQQIRNLLKADGGKKG
ncbi:MAG: helix-turn-helix domain-containing protein [Lentisphaerae bacterium]|nr:helix-turn-helix domain-containing protein [Lentisphaerota bacterium]